MTGYNAPPHPILYCFSRTTLVNGNIRPGTCCSKLMVCPNMLVIIYLCYNMVSVAPIALATEWKKGQDVSEQKPCFVTWTNVRWTAELKQYSYWFYHFVLNHKFSERNQMFQTLYKYQICYIIPFQNFVIVYI